MYLPLIIASLVVGLVILINRVYTHGCRVAGVNMKTLQAVFRITLWFVSVALTACKPGEERPMDTLFTSLSPDESGITFINENFEDQNHNILLYEYFYNGGGVGLADVNNDSLVDIYFTSNQGVNKLYLNKGDLEFEDITSKAGVSGGAGWKTGVSFVDINADGYIDIYVCKSGDQPPSGRRNILYINNHDLTFTDQAEAYGLADDGYTTQAVFFDYDRDGDLDAFILNHSRLTISNSYDIAKRNSNQRVPYVGNRLLRNDNGRFTDVSDASGVYGPASNYGLGVAVADFNKDQWPDLYISNDYTGKDKMLMNNHNGIFVESSDSLLTHMSQFSMGVDVADVNNDGWDDIFSLDMLPENNRRQKELLWPNKYDVYSAMVRNGLHHQYMRNMLHMNNGDGSFSETGQLNGVSNTDWSWSALIADYDLDGRQDLFVTNGFKREFINNDFLKYKADLLFKARKGQKVDKIADLVQRMPSNKVHNYIFHNEEDEGFKDVSASWGFGEATLSNGAAYGDLDNDGDLDLVTSQLDDVARVYRNNSHSKNFLKVRLAGADQNLNGVGGKVSVFTSGRRMTRTLQPVRGFQSSVEPALHFGLDTITVVDSVEVIWPRGEREVFRNVKANQILTCFQKDAKAWDVHIGTEVRFKVDRNAIAFRHQENEFVDYRVQPLLPRPFSTNGPAVASGDVNGDGRMDLYIGGAKDQAGAILMQQVDGSFKTSTQPDLIEDTESENVDAVFADVDNDGDADLYVVNGGFEFQPGHPLLQDKLYKNDGKGNFERSELPELRFSGSCVRPADIDRDGDLDLFIGNRVVPGRYPEPVESYVLVNDGHGIFTKGDVIVKGLVTDAVWADLDNDRTAELIVVGEWMAVKVYKNVSGKLKDESSRFVPAGTEGWWNKVIAADFDKDGDMDLVAGNFGMNNQYKATPSRPAVVDFGDFDRNGSVDPIISYYIGDDLFPSATRDELIDQLPPMRKKYNDYASYAEVNTEVLLKDKLFTSAIRLTANTLMTSYLRNDDGKLTVVALPLSLQVAPVCALAAADVDHDGNLDLITGGNIHKISTRFGKATGNFGTVLRGDGKGNFQTWRSEESGICVKGEVRSIRFENNRLYYFRNDDSPVVYRSSFRD